MLSKKKVKNIFLFSFILQGTAKDPVIDTDVCCSLLQQVRKKKAVKKWHLAPFRVEFRKNLNLFMELIDKHKELQVYVNDDDTSRPPLVSVRCKKCDVDIIKPDSEKYFRYKETICTHLGSKKHEANIETFAKNMEVQTKVNAYFVATPP